MKHWLFWGGTVVLVVSVIGVGIAAMQLFNHTFGTTIQPLTPEQVSAGWLTMAFCGIGVLAAFVCYFAAWLADKMDIDTPEIFP